MSVKPAATIDGVLRTSLTKCLNCGPGGDASVIMIESSESLNMRTGYTYNINGVTRYCESVGRTEIGSAVSFTYYLRDLSGG